MKHLRLISLILISFALTIQTEISAQSQSFTIPVSRSVSGRLVFSGNQVGNNTGISTELYLTNTLTGETNIIVQDARFLSEPRFDATGNRFAFYQGQLGLQTYQISTNSFTTLIPSGTAVLNAESWSPDDSKLLVIEFDYNSELAKFENDLNIVNSNLGTATTLFSYEDGALLTTFPLQSGINQFFVDSISHALWNSIYEDWVLLQFNGSNPEIVNIDGQIQGLVITSLYNLQTQQILSLDSLFENRILTYSLAWHPNGQLLALMIDENIGSSIRLLKFNDANGEANLSVISQADSQGEAVTDWLGVDNLLITVDTEPETRDTVYSISQIISGNLFTTEFLRLPKTQFAATSSADFHLTASHEERYSLSCLFDQAMPTRLEIGSQARVNFTTGTPLRLRAEPDFDSTEIMQMPEGTEFTVIGGKACVNGDDYYRFWQLDLGNGTIGWAAEANTTDYFIEPLEAGN